MASQFRGNFQPKFESMLERDPRRLAIWAAAALVLVLLAAWYLARPRPTADASAPPVATIAVRAPSTGAAAVDDVAGAVHKPGVYRLTTADRIEDALKRAGGATRHADLSQINRAAKLEDGRQILVPKKVTARQAASAPTAAAPTTPSQPINLNTATLEQLDTLDGVGPTTAQKILDYRTQHGGFSSVDELDAIPG